MSKKTTEQSCSKSQRLTGVFRFSSNTQERLTEGRLAVFIIHVIDQCVLQDIQMVLISLDSVTAESRGVNMALSKHL